MKTQPAKIINFEANVKTSRSGGLYHCNVESCGERFDYGQDAARHLRRSHHFTETQANRAIALSNK